MTDYVGNYQLLMANGKATLQDVLDLHAHELAEQIREDVRMAHKHEILELDRDGTASDAANLIDPKVTNV